MEKESETEGERWKREIAEEREMEEEERERR